MVFHPFSVSIPHIAYACLGGFVVLFGMFSLFIREKMYIGEAIWAFVFGVIIGPYCANIFNPRGWGGGDAEVTNQITLEFTRVVLAIGVFAIGVELPKAYMARHWKSLLFLLFPVMTWGWFVSAGLIYALIPGLNFVSSLAVAACLTPTDPILAAAVVGGKYADKHVPAHLRHLLAAESGCNDGAAFPFLFIALYLITDSSTGKAVSDWFLRLWLYQIILGVVIGSLLGFGFRHLMKFCERNDLIDRQSYIAQYVSLAMLTIGVTTLLGSDDLLAAFACGTAFAWDGFFNRQTEESVFSSVIDLLFNIAAFVYVGAWMPFSDFSNPQLTLSVWRLIVIAILVLLVRRLPIMVVLYKWIPDVKTFREAVFSGHFGPMGIGAVFISTLAAGQLPAPSTPPQGQTELLAASIQPIVAFMVLCSIAVHGLSIPFFSLGRRVHSVSRTWSRHDTFGTLGRRSSLSLPEWTTHTRRVVRGEDIVINRDVNDLERGALSSDEKRDRPPSGTPTPPNDRPIVDEKHSGTSSSTGRDEVTREDGTDVREEFPPDGDEIVAEWNEGPDRIIERRAGPGEDVQVEVQKNASSPEETTTETFRVAEDAAEHVVGEIRDKIHNAPNFGEIVHKAQDNFHHNSQDLVDMAHEVEHKAKQAFGMRDERRQNGHNGDHHDEDDEGWVSDASNGQPHASTSAAEEERRSKSPKSKSPKLPKAPSVRPSTGRRRTSIRRGLLGGRPVSSIARSYSDNLLGRHREEPEQDQNGYDAGTESPGDARGRQPALRADTARTASSLRLPRHARVDSLRALESPRPSRDQSPTRSVRFADTPERSGFATPRILSPTSALSPTSSSEVSSDVEGETGVDSPRNVRFSLPADPRG
ncbi:hypothetical protein CERSUDRAFT_112439 [Gelatoporia subvermispora B]|uniref:Cation/H+ exchanger transmembrane domain-containing protein n=1 Tax=Ceriporiopsis subvermispora (strain B) TaxID=914234 RepID=M2RP73_CERS8|nr:hypothetical protein CERSUDRAFT_112439 [Gelatoporia subvermispora B]